MKITSNIATEKCACNFVEIVKKTNNYEKLNKRRSYKGSYKGSTSSRQWSDVHDNICPSNVLISKLNGTPGRILDLTKKEICKLNDCAMLVKDEVK